MSHPARFASTRPTLLAAATLMALSPLAHATNGYFSHGYGVQSQSMAGVGIALPLDGLTAATNPARARLSSATVWTSAPTSSIPAVALTSKTTVPA